jgi:hypothetical protein
MKESRPVGVGALIQKPLTGIRESSAVCAKVFCGRKLISKNRYSIKENNLCFMAADFRR